MAINDAQTSPDYPFTTGPRDWYDGGEPDDTACTTCGASPGGDEGWGGLCWQDGSSSAPTSGHGYRPTTSHDGLSAACSCGWSEPGARHGDRAVAERLTREAWSAHVNGK